MQKMSFLFIFIYILALTSGCGGVSASDNGGSDVYDPGSNSSGGGNYNSNQSSLTWAAPAANEDNSTLDDLAGYKISWGSTPGGYTNEVTVLNPYTTSYTIFDLPAGNYFFVIQAVDTSGNLSPFSNELNKTVI